ncbi:MAG: energy-coupling factor ABC transporter ATP-binding protein [Moorellales bacterium]
MRELVEPILEAVEVEFTYPDGTRALNGVSLAVPRGRRVAVLGPNGAGKTTLFLTFNGLYRPSRGQVRFAGQPLSYRRPELRRLRQEVGIVFQDPDTQLFAPTVWEEVAFGPRNLGLTGMELNLRVEEALAATGLLELRDRPTHFLSYGQKKRVAIADVLAMRPRVIISDEPTAWLDPEQARRTMELFAAIHRSGVTVIFSTHDVDLAYSWSDHVILMVGGTVLASGPPEEIFWRDELLSRAGLPRPWLIDLAKVLGLEPNALPKTREEFLSYLARHSHRSNRSERLDVRGRV